MPPVQKSPLLRLAQVVTQARGTMSQEDFAFLIRQKTDKKLSAGAISQIERNITRSTPETIEAIAKTAGVAPGDIAEYRLAMAREALDERAEGNSLERALELLDAVEEAIRSKGAASARREDAPGAGKRLRSQAGRSAPRKKKAT